MTSPVGSPIPYSLGASFVSGQQPPRSHLMVYSILESESHLVGSDLEGVFRAVLDCSAYMVSMVSSREDCRRVVIFLQQQNDRTSFSATKVKQIEPGTSIENVAMAEVVYAFSQPFVARILFLSEWFSNMDVADQEFVKGTLVSCSNHLKDKFESQHGWREAATLLVNAEKTFYSVCRREIEPELVMVASWEMICTMASLAAYPLGPYATETVDTSRRAFKGAISRVGRGIGIIQPFDGVSAIESMFEQGRIPVGRTISDSRGVLGREKPRPVLREVASSSRLPEESRLRSASDSRMMTNIPLDRDNSDTFRKGHPS